MPFFYSVSQVLMSVLCIMKISIDYFEIFFDIFTPVLAPFLMQSVMSTELMVYPFLQSLVTASLVLTDQTSILCSEDSPS